MAPGAGSTTCSAAGSGTAPGRSSLPNFRSGRMPRNSSPGTSTSIPLYAGPTSTPPGRGKGGSAKGAARRGRHGGAGRPRPWTLARRSDDQAASGRRAGPEADVDRDHCRTARGLSAVRSRPGEDPRLPPRSGQATHPSEPGPRRQGVRLPEGTAPTCAGAASAARSQTRRTRPGTARSSARAVAALRSSTRSTTENATRLSAASTASSDTGPWPRGTTSLRSDTKRPFSSQPSMSGCDQHIRYTP